MNDVALVARLHKSVASSLDQRPAPPTYWVALSGGVDSSVLLDLVSKEKSTQSSLKAIHIHHGLSLHADEWVDHCRKICDRYQVELLVYYAELEGDSNVESEARSARYRFFKQSMAEGDILLQGHHLNDQAETFLYRAIRGAGVKGLSAIPAERPLGDGFLLRPLLSVKREDILAYANIKKLKWVEDESNQSQKFDRNYIRQMLLPKILSRWPSGLERLSHASTYCAESEQLNEALAEIDLEKVACSQFGFTSALNISALKQLSFLRQKNLLRHWLMSVGIGFPGEKGFQAIWRDMLSAGAGTSPVIGCPEGELRSDQYNIYALSQCYVDEENAFYRLMSSSKEALTYRIHLTMDTPEVKLALGVGRLIFTYVKNASEKIDKSTNFIFIPHRVDGEMFDLKIGYRQGGESLKVCGDTKKRPLKVLFQQLGVPVWQRPYLPLLYWNEELAALADRTVASWVEWHASHNSKMTFNNDLPGWLVTWQTNDDSA